MTKVEAIKRLLEDSGGSATWGMIYTNIEKYYPSAKSSREWQAGLRGVLYRELGKQFKRVGLGIYALMDFKEEKIEEVSKQAPQRIHSVMQGICLEIGNFLNLDTYTADPAATYNNLTLNNLATLNIVPPFTYEEILDSAKRIDVLWFNKKGYQFPKRSIEIVDSIGTLEHALRRHLQLIEFNLDFYIIGRREYKAKIEREINKEPYIRVKGRYKVKDYDEIVELYKNPIAYRNDGFLKIETNY
jgi:hypothetical protein